jgi:hypothetical protein
MNTRLLVTSGISTLIVALVLAACQGGENVLPLPPSDASADGASHDGSAADVVSGDGNASGVATGHGDVENGESGPDGASSGEAGPESEGGSPNEAGPDAGIAEGGVGDQ